MTFWVKSTRPGEHLVWDNSSLSDEGINVPDYLYRDSLELGNEHIKRCDSCVKGRMNREGKRLPQIHLEKIQCIGIYRIMLEVLS